MLATLVGCGGAKESASGSPAPVTTTGSPSVTFEDTSTLQVMPGGVVSIAAIARPASGVVRFALLGQYGDAAIEDSAVPVDASGRAETRLHGATTPVTFLVRASVDGVGSAERAAAVSGDGFGSLLISPVYLGKRSTPEWVVTAVAGLSCASAGDGVPPDGPLVAMGASGAPLQLAGVPIGPRIMVTVRSDHTVFGCFDVDGLRVGEIRPLSVATKNVPLVIAPTTLAVALTVAPELALWSKLVEGWRTRFLASFLGGAATGGEALLDTMASDFPPATAVGFQAARAAKGWDQLVKTLPASSAIEVVAGAWLSAASSKLKTAPEGVTGELVAGAASGFSLFSPSTLLGLGNKLGDELTPRVLSWAADPDDKVKLSGSLPFFPSRVVANAVARQAVPSGIPAQVPGVVLAAASCQGLGASFAPSGVAFGACGSACLADACAQAIDTMWTRALRADELAGRQALMTVAATADAKADGNAKLSGFNGVWVGSVAEVASPEISATVKGQATGTP